MTFKAYQPLTPPPFEPVQLAELIDFAPVGNRWVHEFKFDDYRAVSVGTGTTHAFPCYGLEYNDKLRLSSRMRLRCRLD